MAIRRSGPSTPATKGRSPALGMTPQSRERNFDDGANLARVARAMLTHLPPRQANVVQPDRVRVLAVVAIHLEGYIQAVAIVMLLRLVILVDRVDVPVELNADVVSLPVDALHRPSQMMPGVGRNGWTGN